LVASGGEVERFSSSAVLGLSEASIISVVISSLGGLADGRLVGAESNVWDNNSAPKVDFDAIVDGCKKGLELEVGYHLKREDKLSYLSN